MKTADEYAQMAEQALQNAAGYPHNTAVPLRDYYLGRAQVYATLAMASTQQPQISVGTDDLYL